MTPKNLKPILAAVALVGGLLAATALYAQEAAPPGTPMEPGTQGGMMGHDGMMGMMAQMNRMMESCGRMMGSMDDTPNAPDEQPAPAPRG